MTPSVITICIFLLYVVSKGTYIASIVSMLDITLQIRQIEKLMATIYNNYYYATYSSFPLLTFYVHFVITFLALFIRGAFHYSGPILFLYVITIPYMCCVQLSIANPQSVYIHIIIYTSINDLICGHKSTKYLCDKSSPFKTTFKTPHLFTDHHKNIKSPSKISCSILSSHALHTIHFTLQFLQSHML